MDSFFREIRFNWLPLHRGSICSVHLVINTGPETFLKNSKNNTPPSGRTKTLVVACKLVAAYSPEIAYQIDLT